MAVLSIGQVWAADVLAYTIEFQPTTSSTSGRTTSNFVTDMVTSGSSYISSCTATANAYPDVNQIKLGSSSKVGNFTLSLSEAGQVKATKVVLSAKYYDSGKTITLTANSTSETFTPTNAFADYEVTLDGESNLTTISVASVTASKGRMYVNAIKVYVADGGGSTPTPSLSVSPSVIDFGTVDQNAVVANKTVAVTFENLTGSVTYDGLSGAFSASGSISATGDEITISANTATVGEYSQTLTVQSAADSKSQDVTVKMNVVEPFDGSVLEIVKGDFTNTSYDDNAGDHEKGGITFTTAKVYQSGGGIQFQKTNGLLYNKTDLGEIAKIEITTVSGKSNNLVVYSGTTENPTSGAVTGSTSGSVTTYTFAAGKGFFAIKCNSTGASNVDPIKIYYTSSASSVAKPTISGTDNFLTSTEVTMECSTEGAAIYYTITESAKATPATSGDWAAYNGASKPSFSATTTVWAAAKLGDDWSAVAEQTFTKATVMTVAQALAASAGANQYVKGIISSIDEVSTEHGNATYYLKDEGQENSIKIYRGKYLNDAAFTAEDQIYEGDEVTILGTISVYDQVNQFAQGNYIVALKPAARLSWSEASFDAEFEGANTFPSLTNTNGVTVTYSSSNTNAATINPSTGEISLVAVGQTTITASFAGNEDYKAKSVSYTLDVKNSVIRADISFEENGGSEVANLTQQNALPDPLPTITKAGKNFGGWWTTSTFEAGTEAVAGAAVESTDPITLYAKWLEPYSVAQALAMIDAMNDNQVAENSVYVQGKVCVAPDAAPNSGRLTYFISADGDPASDQFQIWLGYGVNGANFTAQTDVQLEDAVVAYGKLKKYVKSATVYPEFDKGSQLYSLVRKADPELAWSETSFDAYIGESNTFPTLTNDHNVAVTYSSTETDYATISNEEGHEGEITLVAVGTTTIKATFAGDEDYKAAEVSYTLNVYNPITAGTITYEENGGSEVADVETPVDNLRIRCRLRPKRIISSQVGGQLLPSRMVHKQ